MKLKATCTNIITAIILIAASACGGSGNNESCDTFGDSTLCASVNDNGYFSYGTAYETDNPTNLTTISLNNDQATVACADGATTSGGLTMLTCNSSEETLYFYCDDGGIVYSDDGAATFYNLGCNSIDFFCYSDGLYYDNCSTGSGLIKETVKDVESALEPTEFEAAAADLMMEQLQ